MPQPHFLSPRGFQAGAAYAGIRQKRAADVAMLICNNVAAAAATFTLNRVVAAPVIIGRDHVAGGRLRGVVVNAGNANACTGAKGLRDARKMCTLTAGHLGCPAELILPSSTGIIGRPMPMEKIAGGIAGAFAALGNSEQHSAQFSDAILTTDTKRKAAAVTVKLNRQTVTIAGVCKGSGMIGPRLALQPPHATMLAYLTTDAQVASPLLRKLLGEASELSFNAVTVDDHTSTNDTAVLLASGASGVTISGAGDRQKFASALNEVCQALAYQIAADGEGATKVVRIEIKNAADANAAKTIARTIANSPLVKTAMHGNDPNWGRIVSAAGYAGVPFDPDRAVLKLQGTIVFRRGQPIPFDDAALSRSLAAAEVRIELDCRAGKASAVCWTCDLSRQYIAINADYHT